MKAYLKAVSFFVPEERLTNEQLATLFPEWSVDKIAAKIGVKERRISAEGELASDLAVKAAERLFADHRIAPEEIDYVLFCTQSPDYQLPTTACLIQERLGIPTSAGAIDYNQGCSGFVYGLGLAKGLIAAGISKNVLLLTAETYTKLLHPQDKGNRTIFGDGAAAALISTAGIAEIGEFALGSDGRGKDNLIVKQGGARYPYNPEVAPTIDEVGNIVSPMHLFMNGAEIFTFTLEAVPVMVRACLEKNLLDRESVGLYIFHQANKYMLTHLRKKIGIPEECFYINMEMYGNTVSSTIPIALAEALAEGRIKSGETVLLAGFGVGYSWAACTLNFL